MLCKKPQGSAKHAYKAVKKKKNRYNFLSLQPLSSMIPRIGITLSSVQGMQSTRTPGASPAPLLLAVLGKRNSLSNKTK